MHFLGSIEIRKWHSSNTNVQMAQKILVRFLVSKVEFNFWIFSGIKTFTC